MFVLGAGTVPRVSCKASGSCRAQVLTWRFPNLIHCGEGKAPAVQDVPGRTDPKAHL